MVIIPYQVDVPIYRWPIFNFVILGTTILVSVAAIGGGLSDALQLRMLLREGNVIGLVGHVLLHVGWIHLFGNMIFLWAFGNAVCAKLGNIPYPFAYAGLAIASGLVHLGFDGAPALGASGAINGIVGMYFVWFPLNAMSCLYWIWVRAGTFSVTGYWMILLWLGFDIWGVASGGGNVAYWGHLGGFFVGVTLATILSCLGIVRPERGERTLLQVLGIPTRGEQRESVERYGHESAERTVATGSRPDGRGQPAGSPEDPDRRAVPASPCPSHLILVCRCGKRLRFPAVHEGKVGSCPGCGVRFRIPFRKAGK